MISNKFRHFYVNKYLIKPLSNNIYNLTYLYEYQALWFRVPKVGTRTMHDYMQRHSRKNGYLYSSPTGYLPHQFKNYYKFAFVRNPLEKFISAYKNKVLSSNYFRFTEKEYQKMQNLSYFIDWVEEQDLRTIDHHLRPQHLLIDTVNLDFLGRFENFAEDFNNLCLKIGMPTQEIPTKNSSGHFNIDPGTHDTHRIMKLYELDYRVFYAHLR